MMYCFMPYRVTHRLLAAQGVGRSLSTKSGTGLVVGPDGLVLGIARIEEVQVLVRLLNLDEFLNPYLKVNQK